MTEADEDDGGWKFAVEDLPEENREAGETADEADEDGEDEGGNVAGSMVLDQPLEPGSPSLENVAFVLLGALSTVLFLLTAVGVI